MLRKDECNFYLGLKNWSFGLFLLWYYCLFSMAMRRNSCGWTVQIKSHERCNDVEMLWSDPIESPELLPGKITTRPHSGTKTSGRQGQPLPWTYNMVYFGMEHQWPMTKCVSLSVWIECLIFWLSVDFYPREEFSFLLFCAQTWRNVPTFFDIVYYDVFLNGQSPPGRSGDALWRHGATALCGTEVTGLGLTFDPELWPVGEKRVVVTKVFELWHSNSASYFL